MTPIERLMKKYGLTALPKLNESNRSHKVIMRMLKGATMCEIARDLGVSRQRVAQLADQALKPRYKRKEGTYYDRKVKNERS